MDTSDTLPRILAGVRVGLHVMFAFLLVFGTVRALDDAPVALTLVLAAVLGAVYLAGTVVERRQVLADRPTSRRWAAVWLGAITGLWIGLASLSPDFVWLEFPLVFLHFYLSPRQTRFVGPISLWGLAVLLPGEMTTASVVGPAVGTLFAVGVAAEYSALHGEARRYRDIAKRLRATQEQLVAAEHQAGRLEERERLAREIHDTLAQGFSSLVLVSRAAKNSLDDRERVSEQLDTIHDVAQENLQEARRFVRDLNDRRAGLADELGRIVEAFRRRGRALGEHTQFELRVADGLRVPTDVHDAVVRVVQEGLNNVVKHAAARRTVVTVEAFSDEVAVDVVDDGRGVGDNPAGYGLTGLRKRVATLGGSLELSPGPGSGTALSARVPLGRRTLDSRDVAG